MTPGAVSQQIQNLEDYVGAALFKRTPKGLLLTDAAQTALPALREAFDRLAEAASLLTAAVDGRRLTVSVAPPSPPSGWCRAWGLFEAAHPQVDVWLSADMEVVDFALGEIDLAIRYGAGRYPGLELVKLMSETVIPVASPELLEINPINAPADLATTSFCTTALPTRTTAARTGRCGSPPARSRAWTGARGPRFNQSSLVIEAAAGGRGVALAKRALAQADLDSGRLVAPLQDATAVDFAYFVSIPRPRAACPQVKASSAGSPPRRPPTTRPCARSTTAPASRRHQARTRRPPKGLVHPPIRTPKRRARAVPNAP